ncbi:electron transfer flavoprotein subunit alpha/FixB family protein [Thermoflexus sp.]|uniref:electron transfer flavoprotein subunit alpha/FixB family protein n=1 Tax=Thermoflexus sp. TaxID=1969742 RepID=UPI0025EEC000|nr:electron transfer flavoprotein subunit alpha/FixB family protein [Thermoflexus sp.]MDW8180525.1 electron transfer flavoprotein subunit alpha/FixB family protein [Anaerolineae bacterium]MCS6962487.1 electron transfer flavoprotein subunit alpha/FixB family protein [Thermoflexus sp.]MCS7351072.1 electron transfer flavoprotein subunit alpha/FixB family protein [Thermoflexus sp.]MCX7690400.1 electron transfer flavoprotein subunit alpha/FixB family protein [Thermoflexus sp.]MDW8183655.1 electron 
MAASLYGPNEAQPALWIYLEHEEGNLERVSLELLSKARDLADAAGWRVAGLLLGHRVDSLVEQAFAWGADEVWVADHPLLDPFRVETHTAMAFQAILQGRPSIFLCGATPNGRDLAGRLAVRLRTGLTADCTDLRLDLEQGGVLIGEVTGFGGGVVALITMPHHRPQMATVRPGVFPLSRPPSERTGAVVPIEGDLRPEDLRTRVVERAIGRGVDLTQAPVLVVGGRGIHGRFDLLQELAALLGGEVGATRPPVDEGFIGRERQVGQTGVVCRPKVAIVSGASGAFQFVVGIQNAGTVIAINTDPEAPIFEFADYGVVGDALQVIPALIEALRAERVAV